jgi:hypothetical protein
MARRRNGIPQRVDALERRMDHVEDAFIALSKRMANLELKVDELIDAVHALPAAIAGAIATALAPRFERIELRLTRLERRVSGLYRSNHRGGNSKGKA